jgi:hypothetical protein
MMAGRSAVAGARAVSEFADSGVLVRAWPVVIGVAAGAIGFVGRKLPADDFTVRGMTTVTGHARAVPGWEKRRRMAVIENRQPAGGAVTGIARACRHEVAAGFAGRRGAVMTRRTGTRCNRTVIKCRRFPRRSGVTVVARGHGYNVCRGLAGGGRTVMTGGTGARGDGTVIKGCWQPRGGAVTAVARRRGYHVITGFAGRRGAVMTRRTGTRGDGTVIKGRW